jgi:methyl-accepting chemotaxis protein
MQAELSQTVGTIRETADAVSIAAAEISQATQDLAQRTETQAHQVQTSTLALQEMSAQVSGTSATSQSVLEVSTEAVNVANEGGIRVSRVVQTMESIQNASRRIGDIVSTINSIAFQTNILALNAAVEAARAGEQGRGFAVVANEVRSLAQRCAEAAKEIKDLIDDTVSRINSGAVHVTEAGEIMQTLLAKVDVSSHLMADVQGAISKQSHEIATATSVMTRLDMMTQQNAAMVEENAAAAESLKMLATELAANMAKFRTSSQLATRASSWPHAADGDRRLQRVGLLAPISSST